MTVLFDGLVDDAALFPPGDAPMAAAVPAHRELRARFGELVGPLVVPAARLGELVAHLPSGGAPFDIALVAAAGDLPTAAGAVDAEERLRLAAVEVPVVADAATARATVGALRDHVVAGVPVAVEVPRTRSRDDVLDVLAGSGHRAKLRTGGLRADLFPAPPELADALAACISRGVPVKCTAGLHHAVRHTDPATGFRHHGFLNVLAAVDALAGGAPVPAAVDWLGQDDGEVLAAAVRTWPADRIARARRIFTSFGTCSVLEPIDDLVALGLLSSPERIRA